MRFALQIEPQQGMRYADQLAIAKRAEANGLEAFFRSDHYASFPGPAGMPTTDAWAVLAGLARDTDRIGLGTLVSPVTFRHPGNLAKVVTTVDEMSGGRLEVGLGAGWNDLEHAQLGLRVPADQGPGRPARGPAGDPARAVGRARRLVVRRSRRVASGMPTSSPSRSTCPGGRGPRSVARDRGSCSAAAGRRGPTASRRATRTSTTSRQPRIPTASDGSTRTSTRRAWRSGATRPR